MKQLRERLMGLGLVALGGSALAVDGPPQALVTSVFPAAVVPVVPPGAPASVTNLRIIPLSLIPSVEPAAAVLPAATTPILQPIIPSVECAPAPASNVEPRKLPPLTVERVCVPAVPRVESYDVVQAGSEPPPVALGVSFMPAKRQTERIDPLWFPSMKSGRGQVPAPAGPIQAGGKHVETGVAAVVASGSTGLSEGVVVPLGGAGVAAGAPAPVEIRVAPVVPISVPLVATRPLAVRLILPWLPADVQPETWPPAGPRVGLVPLEIVRCGCELPPVAPVTPSPIATTPAAPSTMPSATPPSAAGPNWGPSGNAESGSQTKSPPTWTSPKSADSATGSQPANMLPLPAPLKEAANPQTASASTGPAAATALPAVPATPATSAVATAPAVPAVPTSSQHAVAVPAAPATPAAALATPQTSLPAIPTVPATPSPAVAASPSQPAATAAMLPPPQPLIESQSQPVATPQPPAGPAPTMQLPPPRTLDAAPAAPGGGTSPSVLDLPTAPPALMVPQGSPVAGQHGTIGSDPVRISSDYPSIWDVCGTPIRERIEAGLVEDRPNPNRGYVEAELLMWWMNGMHVPALATTTTSPTGMGYLGQPGTVPLLGPGTFLGSFREGLRIRAGTSLDDSNTWGIDGSFFFLGQRDADAAFGSNQYGVLTRPVYSPNTIPGTSTVIGEIGEAVSVPGILDGSLTVHSQSLLFGFDANLSRCLYSDCDSRATVFIGYRNLDLIESIDINENITVVGTGNRVVVTDPFGTMVHVQDRFGTQNYFNGGQIGGTYNRQWMGFDVDARASVALGATQQDLDINGSQTITLPGQAPQTFRGGLLAVGPNLGDFTRTRFSVVPEVTLNLGYWLTPNLKVYAGYNFLFWSDVIRPGNQIDSVVNLASVPNGPTVGPPYPARPTALFQESNLLVHGVQFGAEWRW